MAGMGVIQLIANAFVVLTIESWDQIMFEDGDKYYTLKLDTGSLLFQLILKSVLAVLSIIWGLQGIKTFKPIIKDINRQQFYGNISN
jgi:hypothetical protein